MLNSCLVKSLSSLSTLMQIFIRNTLWISFERIHNPDTTDLERALSLKVIVDHSNVIITCNGILCGMIYQQTYTPGPLNNISKVLVTVNLLIITWNRLQYESHFIEELRASQLAAKDGSAHEGRSARPVTASAYAITHRRKLIKKLESIDKNISRQSVLLASSLML
ncbi:hypothetical protein DL96DRAFT_1734788 [Flagelloscypha sp. PMI_526]|nr:hypothetical protein DL96DRAFT_1734788 [Flagelloscypha sp. PMI_526]